MRCYSTCKRKCYSSRIKSEHHKWEKLWHVIGDFQVSSRACSISQNVVTSYAEFRVTLFCSSEALWGPGLLWGWRGSSFLLQTASTPAAAVHPPPWHIDIFVRRSKLVWAFCWRWAVYCLAAFFLTEVDGLGFCCVEVFSPTSINTIEPLKLWMLTQSWSGWTRWTGFRWLGQRHVLKADYTVEIKICNIRMSSITCGLCWECFKKYS